MKILEELQNKLNKNEFNWLEALEFLASRYEGYDAGYDIYAPNYDPDYIIIVSQLKHLAGNWPTCACGNLCKNLPKMTETNEPKDLKLLKLGILFDHYIRNRSWTEALNTFHEIEQRSTQLLMNEQIQHMQLYISFTYNQNTL